MALLLKLIYTQWFCSIPEPTKSFEGQTVIVTGSNVGLGLEAAKYFAKLGASRLILAVRTTSKGEAAKEEIIRETKATANSIEVWELDLSSYASVEAFAKRADSLDRVDILLENAGIVTGVFKITEKDESTITTNVVSTFLLAYLMLPKLRETARKYNIRPTLTVVSSETHFFTKLKEANAAPPGQLFETLSDESKARMKERYPVTKLLEVFMVREMAAQRPDDPVTFNFMNPGLCHSTLSREGSLFVDILKFLFARSTEYGSRTLVHAASSGKESHGKYLTECAIKKPAPLVLSPEGAELQKRIYKELESRLESIHPGVTKNL